MQPHDHELVRKLKDMISRMTRVWDIRVFGSRARGDAAPDSDMDVLVVLDTVTHDIERYVSHCAWEVGFHADVVIVPITISHHELTDSPLKESVFIRNVMREGVSV